MEGPEERAETTETSASKRALLKSVWVAPVILSVTVPRVVMAQASVPSPPPANPPPSPPPSNPQP
jgi:hypothetical protein